MLGDSIDLFASPQRTQNPQSDQSLQKDQSLQSSKIFKDSTNLMESSSISTYNISPISFVNYPYPYFFILTRAYLCLPVFSSNQYVMIKVFKVISAFKVIKSSSVALGKS